jgi:hypothetical protein
MKKPIPPELELTLNTDILNRLEGASSHSDIIEPIQSCLSSLEGVKSFCPDGRNFSYILWYVNNVVFAYAEGMKNVSLRLSQSGELNFSDATTPKSYLSKNSWYAISYDSDSLSFLVNSAYESAKKS